jgi:hypothetical protein
LDFVETVNIWCKTTRFDVDDDGKQISLAHAQAKALEVAVSRNKYPVQIVIHNMDPETNEYRHAAPSVTWMVIKGPPSR